MTAAPGARRCAVVVALVLAPASSAHSESELSLYGDIDGTVRTTGKRASTEDGFSADKDKNSLFHKLLRIQHLFITRKIFEHFNIPNAVVLFITSRPSRVEEIDRLTRQIMRLPKNQGGGPGSSYVASTSVPYIRDYSTPPPMLDLATREWHRAGTTPFKLI